MKRFNKCFLTLMLSLVSVFSFAACNPFDNGKSSTYINDWGEWTLATAPTCVSEGVETRVSMSNSLIVERRSVPAEHDWEEWEIMNAPICLVAGVEIRACKHCGNSDLRPIPALGHDWGDWEETMISSCTEAGVEMSVCKRDSSHTDIRTAPVAGHDWTDWVTTAAPTCTASGIETRFCRNDNAHTGTRSIAAFGHDWTDWVVVSRPTETADGMEMRVCRNNQAHTETRELYGAATTGLNYVLVNNNTEYMVSGYSGISAKVVIPDYYNNLPVTGIGPYAFAWKYELESITIGANVKLIGHRAFYEAWMKTVTFKRGSQLESIDDYAFMCSRSLEMIEIPAGTKRLGDSAFSNCYNLESVIFANGGNIEHIGYGAFVNCSKLKSFEIPAGITAISDSMFYGCLTMTGVTFADPDKITSIERRAFMYCYELENFEMPANVTVIGEEAFYAAHGAFKLKDIKLHAGIVQVGKQSFAFWNAAQTIYVSGFASAAEADAAWGVDWRSGCNATIVYGGPEDELFNKLFIKGKFDYNAYSDFSEIEPIAAVIKEGRLTERLRRQYAGFIVKTLSINVEYYMYAAGKSGSDYQVNILYDGTILYISQVIMYSNKNEIKQITRHFSPVYNSRGLIEDFYLSQEILLLDTNVHIVATYYPVPATEDAWIVEKSAHERVSFLARCRISYGDNGNNHLYLYAAQEGIWDIEKVWETYKETALNETGTGWRNILIQF